MRGMDRVGGRMRECELLPGRMMRACEHEYHFERGSRFFHVGEIVVHCAWTWVSEGENLSRVRSTRVCEFGRINGLYFISTTSLQLHHASHCRFRDKAIPYPSQQFSPKSQPLSPAFLSPEGNMRNFERTLHLISTEMRSEYKLIIVVMFSRYLEYSEPATKAHLQAQGECEQKDVLIGQLKSEIQELRQLEGDYFRLNELISQLEGKYALLLAERDRADKEQRGKAELDKKQIIDLRADIDDLRVQLQKANLHIEELLRDNTNLKRQTDARSAEIQATRYQLKEAENKNQRSNDDNRALALSIRGYKEERKRLEDECEGLSNFLDVEIGKLKNVEKEVRGIESGNARLEKTLYQAEKDNATLAGDHRNKEQQVKKAEIKLKSTSSAIAELAITYRNSEQQASKARGDFERNNAALNNEIGKGKELQGKIAQVEGAIRSQQNELDLIIAEEEKLRKDHFSSLDKNKNLNSEIDKALALIAEYELVNRELLDEIELFIDQDEQAKSMLSRKEVMRDIVESSLRKIAITEQPIRHLKC